MLVTIIILAILVIALVLVSMNLLFKIEKYEDITVDQTRYLQNISDLVGKSKSHLDKLDEKGTFKSDDEVGFFFEQMVQVQNELNNYMLPENYGKKEEQG